ncbi:peroxiredoxin [Candidatus Bipolaricaulota bacterium]|nr:peroxiredoxin [Candidatus Bipolaricaulota bacterium]
MLKQSEKAPDFRLPDTELKLRSLGEFLGQKVVLAFYPGAFTSVCQKELCSFRDMLARLESLEAQVVGISVDSPFANRAFAEVNRLPFPLLSDFGGKVARQYGGVHEDFLGIPGYTVAKRAVFVLDPGGMVNYAWVSDDPGVEPPYGEIEEALARI